MPSGARHFFVCSADGRKIVGDDDFNAGLAAALVDHGGARPIAREVSGGEPRYVEIGGWLPETNRPVRSATRQWARLGTSIQ